MFVLCPGAAVTVVLQYLYNYKVQRARWFPNISNVRSPTLVLAITSCVILPRSIEKGLLFSELPADPICTRIPFVH